jgi:hypothetical protein
MFGELGQSSLDGLSHRLGIPRSGHPIPIKSDDEDALRSVAFTTGGYASNNA